MLNPHHLHTLRVVLRTGSFADGGKELGYTGSAVSQQIASLERDTGLTLFERSARRVVATPAALALVERIEAVLADLDALERTASDLARGQQGKLRVGSFPTASARLLPTAISAFLEQAPTAEVLLDEGEPAELLPRLMDGELDIAVVYRYDNVPWQPPSSVVVTELLREELLVLQPVAGDADTRTPQHRRSRVLTVNDIAKFHDRRYVAPLPGSAGALCLERICANAGFAPNITFRSNDYAVVAGFVAGGLGIALVPTLAYRPHERITANPVTPTTAHRRMLALHRHHSYQPLREAFLTQLRHSAGGLLNSSR